MKRKTFILTTGKASLLAFMPGVLANACNSAAGSKRSPAFTTNSPLPAHLFFPGNNVWNTAIPSDAPIDLHSSALIAKHKLDSKDDRVIVECAMPYNVVDSTKDDIPFITIKGKDIGEDDPNTNAFPYIPGMVFQNGPYTNNPDDPTDAWDHHLYVVDVGKKYLYETYQLRQLQDGSWLHEGAAFWDLTSNKPRSTTYQDSADAAGLPIVPGLVRMDEINSGVIPHALRITLKNTMDGYIFPATHGTYKNGYYDPPVYLPMGARLRLKSTIDPNKYDKIRKPIIQCLQTYGAIVADNGTNFAITGVNDNTAFKAALGDQYYGPDAHKGDDGSFRLLDPHNNDIAFEDFDVMELGHVTPLPPR